MMLEDIIASKGSQEKLAQSLGIEVHTIQGWLHDNKKMDIEYAWCLFNSYQEEGYILKIQHTHVPLDRDIQPNVVYVYSTQGRLEYAAIDRGGKIKRIPLFQDDLRKHFHSIQHSIEKGEGKPLEEKVIAVLKRVTARRGYYIKKGYDFSPEDLAKPSLLSPKELGAMAEYYRKKITVSDRVRGLQGDVEDTPNRCGRRRKNTDVLHNTFTGKTISLYLEKWSFKNPEEYYRAARAVDKGCPALVHALDSGDISIYRAGEIARLPDHAKQQEHLDQYLNTTRNKSYVKRTKKVTTETP